MMMIQLPMSLIGGAIAQVFYQRAVEAKAEGTSHILVENIFKILVRIGFFPMIMLLFIGREIFVVFFGSQWAIAGVFVQILSVWAFVWFISSPLSTMVAVLEKQSWGLQLNLIIFSTRLISLVIGGLLGNVYITLILFSLSGFIVYGYLCLKIFEFSNVSKSFIIETVSPDLLRGIPAGIFLFLLVLLKINSVVIVLSATIISLIYYVYLFKSEPMINNLINQYFMKLSK
jgi:O-antigen/teichoic acid export membrane protein